MNLYGVYNVVISNQGAGIADFGADFGVRKLVIVQDINKVAPAFRMVVIDDRGDLTHLNVLDSNSRYFEIMIRPISEEDERYKGNEYRFRVYRVKPKSIWSVSNLFDVVGLLDVEGLYEPTRGRGFNTTMGDILEQLASEMNLETEISADLYDESFVLVQPEMTNAEWMKDISEYLYSKGYGYKIFIKVREGRKILTVKSLNDFFRGAVRQAFILNDEPIQDAQPIFAYQIYVNDAVRNVLPSEYGYYDYENGQYVRTSVNLDEYLSLEDYIAVDTRDSDLRSSIKYFGRTIEGMDTSEMAKSHYYGHIPDLVKMWIETWGIPNLCPGDIVKVIFPQIGENIGYVFSGLWMIERVVQEFGKTWRTRLLLTRGSVDVDTTQRKTSLVKANNVAGRAV